MGHVFQYVYFKYIPFTDCVGNNSAVNLVALCYK